MSEVPRQGSQLDRIEKSVDDLRSINTQILDRLTRMEERQNVHATEMGKQEGRLDDHAQRIRDLELATAVAGTTGENRHQTLTQRWSMIGAVALVILGAVLSAASEFFGGVIERLSP
ncbi:hypothetical protein [Salinicola halophilus]|uniref:hypothetical protein n=1 Tax=Salinicola halophilus TaxID=184065 RepID=UPI000DA18A34|nr:hypothetical protein [Salinicola halophilus]